ncbi:MAG: site-2 protease family protein [Microthrixaceae bacterium]
MRTHLRLGRLLGVPIGLNWGVLVVCVLLVVSLAQVSLPAIAPDHPSSAYWFAGVVGMLGFLVSLTGHELGHSYVADRNDVRVVEITLWLFGGVAKLEGDADDPGAEFRIAAAGPTMSMVMAGIFGKRVVGGRSLGRISGARRTARLAGTHQRRARSVEPAAGVPPRRRSHAAELCCGVVRVASWLQLGRRRCGGRSWAGCWWLCHWRS